MGYTYVRWGNRLRKRLEHYRNLRRLKRKELCEMAGISTKQYERIVGVGEPKLRSDPDYKSQDLNLPTIRTLFKLAAALDVEVVDLIPLLDERAELERALGARTEGADAGR